MEEVIRPLLLEVAALTASQQQQQQSLVTLQALLAEREAATEKALLEASASKAAALRTTHEQHTEAATALQAQLGAQATEAETALREAHEQHQQSSTTAQQQHAQALAALHTQLVEREAAMERALLENERLQKVLAAAKLRAGDAELRAGAADAQADDLQVSTEPPCVEAEDFAAAPASCDQDVEGMWHEEDLPELEDLGELEDLRELQEDLEEVLQEDLEEVLQEGMWHEAEAGGGGGGDVGTVGGGGWYQDAEGMWHEEEEDQMEDLQAAGPPQACAEQTREEEEEGSGKRARLAPSEDGWATAPAAVPAAEGGRTAAERRATIEETMRESLALDQLARDRRELVAQRRRVVLDAEQAFENTALEFHAAEASVQVGEAGLQRRLADSVRGANI